MNRVIIDFSAEYIRAVKLSGDELIGCFAVAADSNVGDIFVGRVENVRGEQCFVNYDKNLHNGILEMRDRTLKSGDYIKCQVTREQYGEKGAVLSDRLSLAGHFAVLSDAAKGIKFSHRLDEEQRLRLLASLSYTDYGFIIRKQAAEARPAAIAADMQRLTDSYERVVNAGITNEIKRIHRMDGIDRVLQETEAFGCEIICNRALSVEGFEIEHYQGAVPIFDYFRVTDSLKALYAKKIRLKNGIELSFDRTEAMTVIDVDYGAGFGCNIDAANRSAAGEIAKQIRLRNLSGLIIVDFISTKNAVELKSFVQDLMRQDKEQCAVYIIKELSLIAINRKKRYNEYMLLLEEYPTPGR